MFTIISQDIRLSRLSNLKRTDWFVPTEPAYVIFLEEFMREDVFRSLLRPRVRELLPKPLVEASDVRLARALVENHRAWRVRLARAGKGVVHTRSGLDWMLTPEGETGLAITGMAEEEAEAQLAEAFALFSRKRNPLDVVVTAGQNSGPRDLIGRLVAWGFQPEFQMGMAVDVNALNKRVEFSRDLKLSFCEDVSVLLNGRAKVWTFEMTEMQQFLYRVQPARLEMLTEGSTPDEERIVGEHFAYLKDLTDKGIVLLAGRTLNIDADTFGIIILQAETEDEAQRIMEDDPAVVQGVMLAKLFPYRIALIGEKIKES
ncbi:MAG: YciI family protein [Candidatus Latescibacteria bacterium]|nr:YciI family protein [Candidatus Latescibacterota bacterium]